RSAGGVVGQGPWSKASRAAATARSMSALPAAATRATISSLTGLSISMLSPLSGATHSPPMKSLSGCRMFTPSGVIALSLRPKDSGFVSEVTEDRRARRIERLALPLQFELGSPYLALRVDQVGVDRLD